MSACISAGMYCRYTCLAGWERKGEAFGDAGRGASTGSSMEASPTGLVMRSLARPGHDGRGTGMHYLSGRTSQPGLPAPRDDSYAKKSRGAGRGTGRARKSLVSGQGLLPDLQGAVREAPVWRLLSIEARGRIRARQRLAIMVSADSRDATWMASLSEGLPVWQSEAILTLEGVA